MQIRYWWTCWSSTNANKQGNNNCTVEAWLYAAFIAAIFIPAIFSEFLGFGEHFPSQNRILRPQATIQPIFYHSQPIRLQIIFCATKELEYQLTSSVYPFLTHYGKSRTRIKFGYLTYNAYGMHKTEKYDILECWT